MAINFATIREVRQDASSETSSLLDDDTGDVAVSTSESAALISKRVQGYLVSSNRTLMNILRGMIGPGCLGLAIAFKNSGLLVGFFMTFVIGFINSHCMIMLVTSAQRLCAISGKLELDYGHLAKKAFDYGPERIRPHSKKALAATNFMITAFQFGVCSVQLVFLSENIKSITESYVAIDWNVQWYLLMLFIPVALLCFIRQLRILGILSTFGNLLMVCGFFVIFQLILQPPNQVMQVDWMFHDFRRLLVFLGAILYAFEGQAMILPMENIMVEPKDMVTNFGVIHTGMGLTTIIYAATGFYGFAKYGDEVGGSITLNLPEMWVYQSVKVILVLSVYQAYALQFYVIMDMLWPAILRKLSHSFRRREMLMESIFRIFILICQFTLAFAVPRLEQIIPLVGITAGTTISLIFPPILETMTFWDYWPDPESTHYRLKRFSWLSKNVSLVGLGVFGMVAGLYANILEISESDS